MSNTRKATAPRRTTRTRPVKAVPNPAPPPPAPGQQQQLSDLPLEDQVNILIGELQFRERSTRKLREKCGEKDEVISTLETRVEVLQEQLQQAQGGAPPLASPVAVADDDEDEED